MVFLFDNAGGAFKGMGSGVTKAMAAAGMMPTPKKRLEAFYEKHDPEKVVKVPDTIKRCVCGGGGFT